MGQGHTFHTRSSISLISFTNQQLSNLIQERNASKLICSELMNHIVSSTICFCQKNLDMEFYLLGFLFYFFTCGLCVSDLPIGFHVTLPLPSLYNMTFIGRAFIMETNSTVPNFKVALSVEPVNGRYSCSIKVFLEDFEVWSSGYYSQFLPRKRCRLELTEYGDLQLIGSKGKIGWRAGTSGQGVEKLQLLKTGNLVLTDAMNFIKWQSFTFPTNVILWSQRLSITTRLTSFPSNTTMFFSFEIQPEKIALYLNLGALKYSYWEIRPSRNRNITFAELGSTGLKLFGRKNKKIAQILPRRHEPLRFLALRANTGNLGFYHYSSNRNKFEVSFEALDSTCDLPLACGPYGVCTLSNTCACIQFSRHVYGRDPNCDKGFSGEFCSSRKSVEMVEVGGVSSIWKIPPKRVNVSKEECVNLCIEDCTCAALLYSGTGVSEVLYECFHYVLVRGVKQVEHGIRLSYLVKVPKGIVGDDGSSNLRGWLLLLGGIVDGLIIIVCLGGFGYYIFVVRRRRNNLLVPTEN